MAENQKRRWLKRYPLFAEQVGMGLVAGCFVALFFVGIAIAWMLPMIARLRQ